MSNGVRASVLLALSLLGVLLACRRPADPGHLTAVGLLRKSADSLQRVMDDMDTIELTHLEDLFTAERDRIEAHFKDTLDPATAEALGNYHRALAQALPNALDDRTRLRLHLDSTRARLSALEHDLQHALMEEEEETNAIGRERTDVAGLLQELASIDARIAGARRDHDRYGAVVDSLLNLPVTTP